jgi:hypothetical protein
MWRWSQNSSSFELSRFCLATVILNRTRIHHHMLWQNGKDFIRRDVEPAAPPDGRSCYIVAHLVNALRPDKRVATMSSDPDLYSIYQFAIQLGKDAGKLLQEAAQRRMSGEDQIEEVEKLNSVDIVTQTDEGE